MVDVVEVWWLDLVLDLIVHLELGFVLGLLIESSSELESMVTTSGAPLRGAVEEVVVILLRLAVGGWSRMLSVVFEGG